MRTLMMIVICSLVEVVAHAGGWNDSYVARELRYIDDFYVVEAGWFSEKHDSNLIRLRDSLTSPDRIVFINTNRDTGTNDWYYTVLIGCFGDSLFAEELAQSLCEQQIPATVTKKSFICTENDSIAVIHTANQLWLNHDNNNEFLLHSMGNYAGGQPLLTHDGKYATYSDDSALYVIDLATKNVTRTWPFHGRKLNEDMVVNPFSQISPSGKYIAWVVNNIWEGWSSLEIILPNDSSFVLVDAFNPPYDSSKTPLGLSMLAVRNFVWHPRTDIIFFVMGYGAGTISVGGSIYGIDLGGNCALLISPEAQYDQITMKIFIEGDLLHYEIAHMDANEWYFNKFSQYTVHTDTLHNLFQTKLISGNVCKTLRPSSFQPVR